MPTTFNWSTCNRRRKIYIKSPKASTGDRKTAQGYNEWLESSMNILYKVISSDFCYISPISMNKTSTTKKDMENFLTEKS